MTTNTKPLAERLRAKADILDRIQHFDDEAAADAMKYREIADALDAQAALLSEARDRIADIITIQDIATRTPAAARLSENEVASYRSLLLKLTEATKP